MILRCDSKGDKRFSALFARVGPQSIEDWYQGAKRNGNGYKYKKPKGERAVFFLLDATYVPAITIQFDYYLMLWHAYFKKHKDLLEYAATFQGFQDVFDGHQGVIYTPSAAYPQADRCCQAEAIAHLVYLYVNKQKKHYPKILSHVWRVLLNESNYEEVNDKNESEAV